MDRVYIRPYIRVYAHRPRATDRANLGRNSILFFFLLHARNFERNCRERERSEFLLNRFRDEDGFFESLSTVIGLDLDFDFLIKNSIFLRMVQGQERLDDYIVIERI